MDTTELKQKLHHYIETAQESKLKAIFTMVEDEIAETYDIWDDEEFVNELSSRETQYLNGTAKTYTLQESLAKSRSNISGL